MSYTNFDLKSIDEKRQNKESHKIRGCTCPKIFLNMYQILRQFTTANIYVNVNFLSFLR